MELEEIRETLRVHEEKIDRSLRELELLKQISTDNLMAVLELRKGLEVLSKDFKGFQDEMRAFKDEMRAFKDEINRKWGELANRLGTITEDIFAPGIPYLVQRLGYQLKKRMLDVEFKKDGLYNQYDAIVEAEGEGGEEVVFVAEVKSQLKANHFDEFKRKLENLFFYEPGYREKRVIPVMAAFRVPEDLIKLGNKRGVLLVRMGGEYLEPLNPEVVS